MGALHLRKAKAKAASQRGASITFALLLFLVCAVISSVVIVAATAVGGRASKMAEMDQRYYAVNSAAELLRDVLEKPTMTIVMGTKTVSTVDQSGNETGTTETPLPVEVKYDGTVTTETDSLLTNAALLVAGQTGALPATLSLTATGPEGLDASALAVTITPFLNNGDLCLTISNSAASSGTYKLLLTFKADSTQNTDSATSLGPKKAVIKEGKIAEDEYTMEKTVTKTTTTTVKWKMTGLQTVVAALPTPEPGGGGT